MSRVKDQWTVRVKDADGRTVRKRLPRYGHAKRWLAEWTGSDGRPVTKAFDRKTDAERYGISMEADRRRGAYIDPRHGQVSLREYAERKWLPSQFHLRPNSADTYASHLRNHIYPAFGRRRIGSLTPGST